MTCIILLDCSTFNFLFIKHSLHNSIFTAMDFLYTSLRMLFLCNIPNPPQNSFLDHFIPSPPQPTQLSNLYIRYSIYFFILTKPLEYHTLIPNPFFFSLYYCITLIH